MLFIFSGFIFRCRNFFGISEFLLFTRFLQKLVKTKITVALL